MGFWKTKRGICGDDWADELDNCIEHLSKLKTEDQHEITIADFADLIEFCTRGHIITEFRHHKDGDRPLSQLHDNGIETYSNRGQIHLS